MIKDIIYSLKLLFYNCENEDVYNKNNTITMTCCKATGKT